MKKILILIMLVAGLCGSAFATTNTYASVGVGVFDANSNIGIDDTSELYSAVIGKFNDDKTLAFELEVNYTELEDTESTTDTITTDGTPGTPGTPAGTFPGNGGGWAYGWWKKNGGTPDIPGTPGTTNLISSGIENEVELITTLVNVRRRFVNDSNLTPYIAGGVGATYAEISTVNDTDYEVGFAYQVGAGADIDISESLAIGLNIRWAEILFESNEYINGVQGLISGTYKF